MPAATAPPSRWRPAAGPRLKSGCGCTCWPRPPCSTRWAKTAEQDARARQPAHAQQETAVCAGIKDAAGRSREGRREPKLALLEIRDLSVTFQSGKAAYEVVKSIGFDVHRGETLGIVGESGCGKSVTSLAILGLIPSPPGRVTKGEILFEGQDLLKLPEGKMRDIRGNDISM
ncbi:MAG: ABC transporter ATP-binding protein, partial [Clostridiales bacterium]|nr:ABC transporter ATP-binding protein [Clostridiales bacterium]